MFGRTLVPQNGAAPATRTGTAVASIGAPSVPVQVTNGIRDLMISFASQSQGEIDARRLMEIYVGATLEVAPVIATEAVQSLLYDNPRNPFRPSPQDVFERCERIEKELRTKIGAYFMRWSETSWPVGWPAKWGGAPLTADCRIPDDVIKKYLRPVLAREGAEDDFRWMARASFDRIPADCFKDEAQREAALANITKRDAADEEKRQFEAYIEALEPKLREYHRDCLLRLSGAAANWSRQELMDFVREQIAIDDALRARVAALSEAELSSARRTYGRLDLNVDGPLRGRREHIEKALQAVESRRVAA